MVMTTIIITTIITITIVTTIANITIILIMAIITMVIFTMIVKARNLHSLFCFSHRNEALSSWPREHGAVCGKLHPQVLSKL